MLRFFAALFALNAAMVTTTGCGYKSQSARLAPTRPLPGTQPASHPAQESEAGQLTDRDRAVLATVVLDLISFDDFIYKPYREITNVVVARESHAPPPLIRDWLFGKQAISDLLGGAEIAPSGELAASLSDRNTGCVSLVGLAEMDERIVLAMPPTPPGGQKEEKEVTIDVGNGPLTIRVPIPFEEKYPGAKGWVAPFLPGYSRDGEIAIVVFYCGPSPHGALGRYVLQKTAGTWQIRFRRIDHFA